MTAALLQVQQLAVGHGRRCVAQGLDFSLQAGEVLCLLGANGSGKTTLLRTLLGLLAPLQGQVLLQGRALGSWPRRALAQQLAYVPQQHQGLFAYSALDVVLMGRAAHLARFASPGRSDRALALRCLEHMGMAALAGAQYTALSGGERQLVLIARALAQQSRCLILDEPTASLDFGNQIRVLEQVAALRAQGLAVLMTTHQPEHALRVADRIALLGAGRLRALGAPQSTATPDALAQLYGVSAAAIAQSLHLPATAAPAP